jgi:hypothetical protein
MTIIGTAAAEIREALFGGTTANAPGVDGLTTIATTGTAGGTTIVPIVRIEL